MSGHCVECGLTCDKCPGCRHPRPEAKEMAYRALQTEPKRSADHEPWCSDPKPHKPGESTCATVDYFAKRK
jgi:hypothetical protein